MEPLTVSESVSINILVLVTQIITLLISLVEEYSMPKMCHNIGC